MPTPKVTFVVDTLPLIVAPLPARIWIFAPADTDPPTVTVSDAVSDTPPAANGPFVATVTPARSNVSVAVIDWAVTMPPTDRTVPDRAWTVLPTCCVKSPWHHTPNASPAFSAPLTVTLFAR